jgi:hypothetical protein
MKKFCPTCKRPFEDTQGFVSCERCRHYLAETPGVPLSCTYWTSIEDPRVTKHVSEVQVIR